MVRTSLGSIVPSAHGNAVVQAPAFETNVRPAGVASFTVATQVEPDQRVNVYGTDGRITIEIPFNIPPDRPTRVWHTAGGEPPTDPDTETLTFPATDQYRLQAEAFAAAVREGRPAPLDPEGAVANLAVLDEVRARGRSSPGG